MNIQLFVLWNILLLIFSVEWNIIIYNYRDIESPNSRPYTATWSNKAHVHVSRAHTLGRMSNGVGRHDKPQKESKVESNAALIFPRKESLIALAVKSLEQLRRV